MRLATLAPSANKASEVLTAHQERLEHQVLTANAVNEADLVQPVPLVTQDAMDRPDPLDLQDHKASVDWRVNGESPAVLDQQEVLVKAACLDHKVRTSRIR